MDHPTGDRFSSNLLQPADLPSDWQTSTAVLPEMETPAPRVSNVDATLDALLKRLHAAGSVAESSPAEDARPGAFVPEAPASFQAARVSESVVESLVLKFMLARGDAPGRVVADQVKLPFVLVGELLRRMKYEQLMVYRDSAPMGDYVYQLTDLGRERARKLAEHCTYFGAAPIALEDYLHSVTAQSLSAQNPTPADLRRAFQDSVDQ